MPDITEEDVRQAEADARAAQQRFLTLQHNALNGEPGDRPAAVDVIAAQTEAQHAEMRIEVARRRFAEATEAARIAGHHAIGARIGQLAEASAPGAEQVAVLRQLAELAAAVRSRAADHDTAVRALYAEASGLHSTSMDNPVLRTGNTGPWAPHMAPQAVRYKNTGIHVLGGSADLAIAAAVQGDVDEAVKHLTAVSDHTPPKPTGYIKDTLPQFGVMPLFGRPDRNTEEMLRIGRFVKMSQQEVAEWQASRQQ